MRVPCWWDKFWWRVGLAALAFFLGWWFAARADTLPGVKNEALLDEGNMPMHLWPQVEKEKIVECLGRGGQFSYVLNFSTRDVHWYCVMPPLIDPGTKPHSAKIPAFAPILAGSVDKTFVDVVKQAFAACAQHDGATPYRIAPSGTLTCDDAAKEVRTPQEILSELNTESAAAVCRIVFSLALEKFDSAQGVLICRK